MLLGESHYRHQIEADIRPFRDILLGLFFVSIGMLIDLQLFVHHGFLILGLTLARLEGERTRALALNLLMIWLVYQFYGLVELAPTMEEIIPYVWGGTGLLAGTVAAPDHS